MKPVGQNILVKPFPPDDISEGGVIVPDSLKKPSNKVTVIAVGPGTEKKPMRIRQGDVGFRIKDCGTEVPIDGETYFLLHQDWLLATLN